MITRSFGRDGLLATITVGAVLVATAAVAGPAAAAPQQQIDPQHPDFGPNVTIVSPATPLAQVAATLQAIANQQRDAEMTDARKAVYFLPGTYGTSGNPLQFELGYYTEVAGLGLSPDDVTLDGKVEVYNRCLAGGGTPNCLALVNFWRTLSNLALHVDGAGQDGCRASANF